MKMNSAENKLPGTGMKMKSQEMKLPGGRRKFE